MENLFYTVAFDVKLHSEGSIKSYPAVEFVQELGW